MCGGRRTAQKAPKSESVMAFPVGNWRRTMSTGGRKWRRFRILAGMFFPLSDLLQECLRFFLISEGQPRKALFEFKGVKERAILVI